MKNLQSQNLSSFCSKNWLISLTYIAFTSSCLLIACSKSFAGGLRNHAAVVDSVSNTGVSHEIKKPATRLNPASINRSTRKPRIEAGSPSLIIVEKNAFVGFGFIYQLDRNSAWQDARNHYRTKPNNSTATYSYPCGLGKKSTFVVGWSRGIQNQGCDAVKVSSGQQSNLISFNQPKNLLKAETNKGSDKSFRYCSAVAESDLGEPVSGWGAVLTYAPWDLLSSKDPCKEAIRRCEEVKSGNSTCVAVNMGEQDLKGLDEEFTAVLKCSIENADIHREQKIPEELDRWLKQQASDTLKSSSCTLHVLNSDELLIFPTTPDTTLIATGDDIKPFNEPVVVALAGKVKVVSPDLARQPIEIAAGNACYPDGTFPLQPSTPVPTNPVQSPVAPSQNPVNIQTPIFTKQVYQQQNQQSPYQQQQQQQPSSQAGNPTCQPFTLTPDVREAVVQNNPVIRDFFVIAPANDPDAEGWSSLFAESIESYKASVIGEFGTYDGEAIEGFANLLP